MAQIQIWTRDVDGFQNLWGTKPQHTFLIKVNDDGTREILRGGPDTNMVSGDIKIIKKPYDVVNIPSDYYDPSSTSNPLNYQGTTIESAPPITNRHPLEQSLERRPKHQLSKLRLRTLHPKLQHRYQPTG